MFLVPSLSSLRSPARGCGNPQLPSLVPRRPPGDLKGAAAASLFAGIRRSSRWSLLEDSGETSFSNRNDPFRFEEEEPGESCRYPAFGRIPAIHPCDDAVPFGAFLSPLSLGKQRKRPARGDGTGPRSCKDNRRIRRGSENSPLRRDEGREFWFSFNPRFFAPHPDTPSTRSRRAGPGTCRYRASGPGRPSGQRPAGRRGGPPSARWRSGWHYTAPA